MAKFVVLYIGSMSAETQIAESTPEQAEAGMKAWTDWAAKTGDALVDFGTPLGTGREVSVSGVSDTATGVGGYSILEADDLQAAVDLVKDHPHFMSGGGSSIQIYPALEIPGM
ncbi:YciI family protein [Arthrobacter celericrescens]|uniref:YciI family protein n=1 Tax=Arthrobacter celericrescens TaxID=2320851 RepID=UPI0013C511FC|nr:YciI family protein [Arthrobacter celericrescens]